MLVFDILVIFIKEEEDLGLIGVDKVGNFISGDFLTGNKVMGFTEESGVIEMVRKIWFV